jgi:hypothetical protein
LGSAALFMVAFFGVLVIKDLLLFKLLRR